LVIIRTWISWGYCFHNIKESESNIARGFNHGKPIGKTHCIPVVETTGYVSQIGNKTNQNKKAAIITITAFHILKIKFHNKSFYIP
jgi:hypothetical protein